MAVKIPNGIPWFSHKSKVEIFSICTPSCQELINLSSGLTMMESSAGRTGYPPSHFTWQQGPPVSHSLWEVGGHLVKFILWHHHGSDSVLLVSVLNVPLSPTQHLWNIRMLHNDWVESKNQATHIEVWEPYVGEKNNLNLNIIFLFKAVNVLEATLNIWYRLRKGKDVLCL